MDYDSLLELLKNRRSIRRFKLDPVPDEYVDKIIEAARWAPSGFNSQPWEFVVVRKQELKDRIVQLIDGPKSQRIRAEAEATREPWQGPPWRPPPRGVTDYSGPMDYSKAPVFIALLGDTRTRAGMPMKLRFDDQSWRKVFNSGLASAFLYMHLAATTLGLASQWIWYGDPLAHCLLKDHLGIPMEMEVYDIMAVGYPALKPRPKLMRAKEKMVHYDYCGEKDFRTDEEVRDYIRRNRAWIMATMRREPD